MLDTSPGKNSAGRGLRSDWARLTGHTVEVWLLGEHIVTGVVEQAADDDSVLWIAAAGTSSRKLFDKPTGYRILV
jgi:hypothetical protein